MIWKINGKFFHVFLAAESDNKIWPYFGRHFEKIVKNSLLYISENIDFRKKSVQKIKLLKFSTMKVLCIIFIILIIYA